MIKKTITYTVLLLTIFLSNIDITYSEGKKDRLKAFVLSLVIPGLGQYYVESPGYAKLFIGAELAIWGAYYYNTQMKRSSRQDYLSQAALHAGVNPKGFGTPYLNAVGAYNSSFEYNQRKLQSTPPYVLYTGNKKWEWDAEADRLRFRNLRERELDYENNIKYCVAGIIFNHFVSALNASKLVQRKDKTISFITINTLNDGLIATYKRSF